MILEVLANVVMKDGFKRGWGGGGVRIWSWWISFSYPNGCPGKNLSSFNLELLKNFIVSQILGPEAGLRSYYTQYMVVIFS